MSDRSDSQPDSPSFRQKWHRWVAWCKDGLNFFRVHVLVFTFTPLIAAAIFYAANTKVHIPFIDCLFVCVSAMTVTGLTTINVSTASLFQQAILFFLMCIGNISAVSVIMVLIRRHFFRQKFQNVIRNCAATRKKLKDIEDHERRQNHRPLTMWQRMLRVKTLDSNSNNDQSGLDRSSSVDSSSSTASDIRKHERKKRRKGPVRADMIRRTEGPAFLINSAGDRTTAVPEPPQETATVLYDDEPLRSSPQPLDPQESSFSPSPQRQNQSIRIALPNSHNPLSTNETTAVSNLNVPVRKRTSLPHFPSSHDETVETDDDQDHIESQPPQSAGPLRSRVSSSIDQSSRSHRHRGLSDPPQSPFRRGSDASVAGPRPAARAKVFPRSQTVEFAEPIDFRSREEDEMRGHATAFLPSLGNSNLRNRMTGREFERTMTGRSYRSSYSGNHHRGVPMTRTQTTSKQRGFGGFPTPIEIAGMAFRKVLPKVQEKLQRTMTIPRTSTFASGRSSGAHSMPTRPAPYLSFDATVSGNSRFHDLTDAQRDELGGVEYRALDLLAKLIPFYLIFCNVFFIVLVIPYVNSGAFKKYQPVFKAQGATKPSYSWFWIFQIISAYTNTGMSLIDTSMTQMQDAYMLLIPIGLMILAGNTAFPIFLRFFIWTISKVVPQRSRLYETLRFLLDHPRRCFIYLFPSGQTWLLLVILIAFTVADWVAFLVLDIGNQAIESIQVGIRVFDGLFQSIAVRAAGFQVVNLLGLAPAVQFLYVIMMYLSAFPLAMSVRTTNVYEENSLGIYGPEPDDPTEIPEGQHDAKMWGSFLAAHARRQLAFDIWWLGFSLWLICIFERHAIMDPETNAWFSIFHCLFELTSAYGTVGLSTGTPVDNFSLSGRFSTLSKLVVCLVMLRGRHRGLPVAIDRAILLPTELHVEDVDDSSLGGLDTWERPSTFVDSVAGQSHRQSVDKRLSWPQLRRMQSAASATNQQSSSTNETGGGVIPPSPTLRATLLQTEARTIHPQLSSGGLMAAAMVPALSAIDEGVSTPVSEYRVAKYPEMELDEPTGSLHNETFTSKTDEEETSKSNQYSSGSGSDHDSRKGKARAGI